MKLIKDVPVLETLEEIVDPKHTALLVIDIQNDNSSPKGALALNGRDISWSRNILPRVKTVLEEARRLKLLIIFMRMTRSIDGSHESAPRLRLLEKSPHIRGLEDYELEGTWGHDVLDELEPRENELRISKYRSSAFVGTPLDIVLRNRGIKTAVFVGLVTEGCVEATVRDAEQYGYYPVVLSDCVCCSRLDLHEAALLVMSWRYDVITSNKLFEVWCSISA